MLTFLRSIAGSNSSLLHQRLETLGGQWRELLPSTSMYVVWECREYSSFQVCKSSLPLQHHFCELLHRLTRIV